MGMLWSVIYIIVTVAIMLATLMLGRKYIFSKFRINKWIPLAITIVLFIAQLFFKVKNIWLSMLFTVLILWFFMWFMDIHSTGGAKKKEKKIEIRPKAKPNRVKHIQNKNK